MAGARKGTERYEGLTSLGQALKPVTKPMLAKRPRAEVALLESWESIAGTLVSGWARPVSLRFPKRGEHLAGTLTLKVDRAFASDLQHMERQVIERVNGFFGYEAVKRLRMLQVAQLEPPHGGQARREPPAPYDPLPEESLSPVQSDGLRQALARLGGAIRSRSKDRG